MVPYLVRGITRNKRVAARGEPRSPRCRASFIVTERLSYSFGTFRLSHELVQFQKKQPNRTKPRFHRRAAYLPTSLGNRQSTEGKSNDPTRGIKVKHSDLLSEGSTGPA